jgi:hypothetical protein
MERKEQSAAWNMTLALMTGMVIIIAFVAVMKVVLAMLGGIFG